MKVLAWFVNALLWRLTCIICSLMSAWLFHVAVLPPCRYAGWTVPYVLERLEADYRLPCPMACPQRVYDECVRPCWSAAATRPSFYDVHEWLLAVSGNKSTEDDGLGDGNERGRALHRSVKADSGVPSVVTSSV